MRNVKMKIAIFRALHLGDMLCIIPAVRAVRRAFPAAEITLVGLPWQADFASRFCHYFDRFIEFPGWPGLPEQEPDQERIQLFLSDIRNEAFDLVLQMQGNGEITNRMCSLWNGRKILGLRRADDHSPGYRRFPVSEDSDHEILRFFNLTDALNIPRQGEHLEFPLSARDLSEFRAVADTLGISPGTYICLHPGARDKRRRWPLSNFAYVGSRLASQGKILLTGSESERDLLDEVAGHMSHDVINTVGRLGRVSLGLLAAFINNSKLLISNDTGVSHIAAALKVPSIIIFSPYSDVARWAPLNPILHRIVLPEASDDPENVVQAARRQIRRMQDDRSIQVSFPQEKIL